MQILGFLGRGLRRRQSKAFSRRCAVPLAVLATVSQFSPTARGAADTWVGGQSANFSSSDWTGGNPTPLDGDALFFGAAGATGTSLNNDLAAGLNIAGLTFNAGASAYTLSGNAITLTAGILNSSTALETINFAIATAGVQTITLTAGGGNVTIGGNISGAGGGITTAGAGTLTLNGINSYTGATTVAAGTTLTLTGANTTSGAASISGTLNFNSASALGTSAVTFNAGSALDNTTAAAITDSQVNAQTWAGSFTFGGTRALNMGTGAITLTAASTITVNGTGANGVLTEGGPISLGTFNLGKAGTGSLILNGIIAATAGTVSVSAGTLTLAGVNLYTGSTTLSGGQLNFNNAKATGTGTLIISGGTLDNTTAAAITGTSNNVITLSGDFAFGGTQSLNLGTGAVTLTAARTITTNGTGTLTFGGAISGATFNITKAGSGILALGGVIGTTTGGLAVSNGTLIVTNGANTFTGVVTVDGPTSVLQMTGSNGNGTAGPLGIVTGGTAYKLVTLTNGATFRPSSTYNVNVVSATAPGAGYVFTIGTGGAVFDTPTGVTFTVDDGTTGVTGTGLTAQQLQGSGALTKTGVGILQLRQQFNFGGTITIAAGTLQATGVSGVFGANTANSTIQSGATFDVNGNLVTDTDVLSVSGTGLASTPRGVIVNNSATAGGYAGPVLVVGDSTIGTTAAGNLTLSGVISGTGNLTFSNTSTGVTILSAVNTYVGQTNVTAGTLSINVVGGASGGKINVTGGTLVETLANAITGNNSLAVSGGTANLNFANNYTGGTTVSGTGVLNASVAGAVPAGLTVSGGTVNVSAVGGIANATVTGGTVVSSATTGAANGGTINLNGGLLTTPLGAAGGVFGTIVGGSTPNTINPGGVGTVGSLSIASLTTGTGTLLQFDLTNPWTVTPSTTGDLLVITAAGGLVVNGGTVSFVSGAPTAAGEYRLIQLPGAAPANLNTLLPVSPRAGVTYSFDTVNDPGFIDLLVGNSAVAVNGNWIPTAAASFSWNAGANWVGGALPSVSGDTAIFNTALAGAQTVTLDAPIHVGTLTLSPTTANAYTITAGTGGTLSLDNGAAAAQVTNVAGNNVISAPVFLLSGNSNFNVASGTTLTLSGVLNGTGKLTLAAGATSGGTLLLAGSNLNTGGIEIDSGTLSTSRTDNLALGNQGVGTVILNGGTLSYTAGTTQITPAAGFVLNFGTNGGTLNTGGAGTTGKLLMSNVNQFTGTGTFTKTGAADLQINASSLTFSGNVNINGLIELQSISGLGGGAFNVGTGGELVASGIAIPNAVTLSGGILSANSGTNNSRFTGTVNVTAASTLAARPFQGTTTPENFAINTLTGTGNLTVIGNTTGAIGMVTLNNASGYTGTIAVNSNGAIGIGTSSPANFFGSNNAIGLTALTSAVGLLSDGDGTGTPQTIAFALPTNAFNFVANNVGGYFVGKQGGTLLSSQSANKTISLSAPLPYNATNALNVTPLNGDGLLLTAQPAMGAITSFNVGGLLTAVQASNVVPGLALSNLTSTGTTGILKTGTGTLALIGGGNTFGGAGALIDVGGGVVSASSDAALGNASNGIRLDTFTVSGTTVAASATVTVGTTNGLVVGQTITGTGLPAGELITAINAATNTITITTGTGVTAGTNTLTLTGSAGFLATGTFATSRTVTINLPSTASIGVSGGNTLTLNTGIAVTAAADTLTKTENGTLVLLGASTGGWTGATTINAGAIKPLNSGVAGTGGYVVANNLGAAIQFDTTTLNGGTPTATTFSVPLNISSGGIQGRGAIENISGANTVSGLVTVANAAVIGNDDAASLLTFSNAAFTNTGGFNVVGPGAVSITGVISGAGAMNTASANANLTLTGVETSTGALQAIGGTLTLSGAGKNGTGNVNILYGGTFNYDNTATNVASRNNARTNSITGGTINLIGNAAAATTETFLGITFQRGEDIVNVVPGAGQQANLTLLSGAGVWTHGINNGMVVFQGANLGSAAGPGVATITIGTTTGTAPVFQGAGGAGTVTKGILPYALAINTTTGATGFATADTITGLIRPLNTSTEAVNNFGVFTAGVNTAQGANLYFNSAVTATGTGVTSNALMSNLNNAANSLTLDVGGKLTQQASPQTLTLGGAPGAGILALDSATGNTISGGILTAGANELDIHTVGNLTISSAITGGTGGTGTGVNKGESGTLTFAAPQFYSGQTIVEAGTLVLAGGNNTIRYGGYLTVGTNATLNIGGTTALFTDVLVDNQVLTGLGTLGNTGFITGTAGGSLVVRNDGATSRNFTGTIQGGLGLLRSGSTTWTLTQNETYTGPTVIEGGTVVLQNSGAFSGTSGLTINRATLTLDNTGSLDVATRLPTGLAITLGGGTINYLGRVQFASAETLGAVTTTEGANGFSITQQTTGVSTAALTLTSLTRAAGSTVNFSNTNGTLGQMGSNPNILITANPTLANGIMGGGFIVNGTDFASYNPTFGVGALGAVGFAGYSPLLINNAAATDNVSISAGTGVSLNNQTINSLRVTGTTAINFNAGQTLTLATGGLLLNANLTLGSAVNNGSLTSGGPELFLYVNGGTSIINSSIVGPGMSLVKSGAGTAVTLAGTNTYTGGTYVDQGTLTVGATGQLGTGGIFINGGTLVQTALGVIPSQAVSMSGAGVLTLAGNNTFSSLSFNNNGGTTAPNISTTGGVLTVTSGAITGSSISPITTSVITAGTLDLNNVATPTITVNPISFNGQNISPLVPTLAITAAIQNANNAILVTGGGNLQLGGQSTFSGGVNLAAGTNLTLAGNSTNSTGGTPVTGPLGTGTLTIGSGSTLYATATQTVTNAVAIAGSFSFDNTTATAANLTIGGLGTTTTLPAGATTITVIAPQAIGTLGGVVTGAGSSIIKAGLGTLALTNNSTFSGGVTINNGTLLAAGPSGGSSAALGSGTVILNGGLLALRNNGTGNFGSITYGNNVTINGTLPSAFIDINTNGGTQVGNTIVMGTLDYTGFTAGSAAPSTLLNISGGSNYKLQFTGTTLTTATSSPTFNVATGLTLILPGGFTIGSNLPTNIGLGSLVYSGNNIGTAGTITGTTGIAPPTGSTTTPLGSGPITLSGGSTLQISPVLGTLSATGYTAGGLSGKFYFTGAATLASASNFGIAPNSVIAGVLPNDANFRATPVGVNAGTVQNSLGLYQGLLNITTGGTYAFGSGSDDMFQLFVDGSIVTSDIGAGHGLNQNAAGFISLAAGLHTIEARGFNNGGGGGLYVVYSGPDTGANGLTGTQPVNNFQSIPLGKLSYTVAAPSAANNYLNAAGLGNDIIVAPGISATIDGIGTTFNASIASLTLGAGSTLVVANGNGTTQLGTGAVSVVGVTDVSAGTAILNQTTGILVLAGGVNDGGQGLTKTGAGTLILGASTSFSGPLNINGGFVQVADPAGLTTGATLIGNGTLTATLDLNGQAITTTGDITLNGGAGPTLKTSNSPAGLYNSSATTASFGGNLNIGLAVATVNASIGGFGNIVLNGTVQDTAAAGLDKVGPDTLVLNGSNSFASVLNVKGGIVRVGSGSALGGIAGATVVSAGAALDLNGQDIGSEPLTLNGAGATALGAPNTLGSLFNSNATAAFASGPITLASASSIGGSSFNGGVAGDISLSGAIAGNFVLTKVGANTLNLIDGAEGITSLTVNAGKVVMSGAAVQGTASANGNIILPGATLVLDNTSTATSNRIGGRGFFENGNLTLIGNAGTAVTEVVSTTGNNYNLGTNGTGQSTITLDATAGGAVSIVINSTNTAVFTRSVGTSLLIRGTNLGNAPGAGVATFTGGATSLGTAASTGQTGALATTNQLILPWATVDQSATGLGTSFASYNGITQGYQPLQAGSFITATPGVVLVNVNTTNGSTAVTTTNTAGLVVGELVVGTGIAANTTIASITPGTGFTLSANATATANNTLAFEAGTGTFANLVTSAPQTAGSAVVTQELNSVTLNSGGSLNIPLGLQIDSGGILVTGNNATPTAYAISGPGTLSATNGLNRELIVHVVGSATTLNITAPIFDNNSLTKADGGTLVLGAKENYTGNTFITSGTLKLAGGNNTIFNSYATAPSAGNSGTGTGAQGQILFVDNGGTLDLNGTTQAVSVLNTGNTNPLMGGTILNSNAAAATLHLSPNAATTWSGNISNAGAGVLNLVRDGNNNLIFNSPNTLSGSTTITGGVITLQDLGTLENSSSITVTRGALIWNDNGTQAAGNRIKSTAPITLNGGGIQFVPRAGTGATPVDNITLGAVTVGLGDSDILINPTYGSAGSITIPALPTRVTGATLNFGGGAGTPGDNPRLFITAAPTQTNGLIGAWFTTTGLDPSLIATGYGFATYDPVGGVTMLNYGASNFAPGNNTRVTANQTLPSGTITTNSLTAAASITLSFANPTDTLILQSGGLLVGNFALGNNTNPTLSPGQVTIGAGQSEFFIHTFASTDTINAKILDNGVAGGMNVVVDNLSGAGANTTFANANTYLGKTYVNGGTLILSSITAGGAGAGPAVPGDLILSGGNNAATDSLPFNATNVQLNAPNQIATTSNVTMNGSTQINLNSNSNTVAGVTINNDGGSNGGGPTIFTGVGTLTVTGAVNVIAQQDTFTVPTINGFVNLPSGAINVDANVFNPGQLGLAVNANITAPSLTKTGVGLLGIGGQSQNFTGTLNVAAGSLAFSAGGALLGGQVLLAPNTSIDTRGVTGTIGSLASASATSTVTNGIQATAGTLVAGADNSNTTFAGTFSSPFPIGQVNFTKIGNGTLTVTGNSTPTNSGTFTEDGGNLLLNSTGQLGFTTTTVATGGTITLDNTAAAVNNRLGGATLTPSVAILAPTVRTLTLAGGNLTINGNAATAVTETLGAVTGLNGSILTLNAAGTAGINVTLASIGGQGQPTSLLIRGTGLGSAAGPGIATLQFATAGTPGTAPGYGTPGTQGGGASGTVTMTVRPDIIADASATGSGTGFLAKDPTTGLLRPLTASELSSALATATGTTNVGLSASVGLSANAAANTLTLQSGGGIKSAIVAGNPWGANGGLLTVAMNAAGVLAFGGNTGITLGQTTNNGITTDYHVVGAGAVLNLNAVLNGNSGLVKAGAGTLVLSQPQFTNVAVNGINGGTLQLNAGANTLWVQPTSTVPTANALAVNQGTLDLNGNNQLVAALTTTNPLPFAGGTAAAPNASITNTSGTAATFTTSNANSVFSGVLTGNLNFDKQGTGTMVLSSANNYTGTTFVRGGILSLRDSGTLSNTSAINVNYGTFQIDQTGLTDFTARVTTAAPINLNGGIYKINATESVEAQNTGTINVSQGYNEINVTQYNNNAQTGSYSLNVANLTQSGGSLLNFTSSQTYGLAAANPHVFLTAVNGTAFNASSLQNNIIAPWAVVNGADFASYNNATGVIAVGQTGAPGYSGNALGAGVAADNINVTATVQSVTSRTVNTVAVRAPGAATTIGLNSAADVLTIAGGGLLINSGQTIAIQGGQITSGAAGAASTLYIDTSGTGAETINSQITNNVGGAVSVARSGGATLTLSPLVVDTVASVPVTSTTITVPNATGLFVGMGVSGTNITAGSTITAIAGTTVTLSAATGATAGTTVQVSFTPPTIAASTTTAESAAVTLGSAAPSGITVGMAVGGPNIAGGTTVAAVSGTSLTLSQPAIASGAGNVTLGALSNTYTGTTFNNGGAATFGTLNLSGQAGAIVVPGNLVIGNTGVVMNTNQGQVAAASVLSWVGGGTFTTIGTNTFNSLNFASTGTSGGNGAIVGTSGSLNVINLSAATPISVVSDNVTTSPAIGSTGVGQGANLNLNNATGSTINVTGLSPDGIQLLAPIPVATAGITKVGGGSLILNPTVVTSGTTTAGSATVAIVPTGLSVGMAVTGGGLPAGETITAVTPTSITLSTGTGVTAGTANLTFTGSTFATGVNLSAGTLILAQSSTPTAGAVLSGPLGTGTLTVSGSGTIMAGTAAVTEANAVQFNTGSTLTFGGTVAGNQVTLSGPVNLNGAAPTIAVSAAVLTDTITGIVSGAGGFTKAGPGALTLTPTAANTYTGPVNVAAGLLTLGNANALPAGLPVTVGAAAELNINGLATATGSLAGGGIITNSGAAAVLTTGGDGTSTTFSGSLVAATPANLGVTKTGTGTQTFTGVSTYAGNTIINGGTLAVNNDAALGAGTNTVTVLTGASLSTIATFASNTRGLLVDATAGGTVNVAPGTTLTYGGVIANANPGGILNKAGTGTMVVTATNTYSGGTNVSAGLLAANNTTSSTGAGPVNVTGGAVGGIGKIVGALTLTSTATASGAITGGNSTTDVSQTGALTVAGATSWQTGASYVWKVQTGLGAPAVAGAAAGSGGYDQLVLSSLDFAAGTGPATTYTISVVGTAKLPGGNPSGAQPSFIYEIARVPNAAVTVGGVTGFPAGTSFNVITDAPVAGTFAVVLDPGGLTLAGSGGTSVQGIDLVFTPTPEPVVTGILGLAALALVRRPGRRRRKSVEAAAAAC